MYSERLVLANDTDNTGSTIAHIAAINDSLELLHWLQTAGLFDVKAKNEMGENRGDLRSGVRSSGDLETDAL